MALVHSMNRVVDGFAIPFILSEGVDDFESSRGDQSFPLHELELVVLVDLDWLFVRLEPVVDFIGEGEFHQMIFSVDGKIFAQRFDILGWLGEEILELLSEGIDGGVDLA